MILQHGRLNYLIILVLLQPIYINNRALSYYFYQTFGEVTELTEHVYEQV